MRDWLMMTVRAFAVVGAMLSGTQATVLIWDAGDRFLAVVVSLVFATFTLGEIGCALKMIAGEEETHA